MATVEALIPIRLLGDRLIVRPIPFEQSGLIELPSSLKDQNNVSGPKLYWVMLVGPGRLAKNGERIPVEVGFLDRVILHSYTKGVEHAGCLEGDDVIVTMDQVLLVLPKELV